MSGSRRFSQYRDDLDNIWAVDLDEDTIESPDLGFDNGLNDLEAYILPQTGRRPLKMRYINAFRIEGVGAGAKTIRKTFPVSTQSDFMNIVGSFQVGGVTWSVRSKRGESRELVPRFDTEINDGDVDDNSLPVGP